jgi:hypothetical protein
MADSYKIHLRGIKQLDRNDTTVYTMTAVDDNDDVVDLSSTITLDGYAIGTAGAVDGEDTVLDAIAKLEARVVALEEA